MCKSLTEVVLPDTLISINDFAFDFCTKLTDITLPDSLTTICVGAFYQCNSLTELTIPESVTTISDYTFDSCYALTEVTIPKTVTAIGESAFYGCGALTDIYYAGTEAQWNAINIDASNGYLAGTDAGCWTKNYCPYSDVIYIDRIAFVYSSTLTALAVNGVPATLNGNDFTGSSLTVTGNMTVEINR